MMLFVQGLTIPEIANILTVKAVIDIFSNFFHGPIGDLEVLRRMFNRPKKVLYTVWGILSAVALTSKRIINCKKAVPEAIHISSVCDLIFSALKT